MVVKIQVPLTGEPEVLIYNEDKSYYQMLPFDDNFKNIMDKSFKKYFQVKIENNKLVLIKEVSEPDW